MIRSVRFHSHACLTVEGERDVLLMDPWLFGDVFNGAWSLRPAPDIEALNLSRVRHIWLSHQHPDHFHVPSLRLIRERNPGPVTVYYRRTRHRAVRDALGALGFDVVELTPHRETAIADDMSIALFPSGYDSALAIRLGDRVVLNQNDCALTRGEIQVLLGMFPRIDAWLYQFSLGGYCANPDDAAGLEAARRYQLGQIARYHAALRPRTFVPFASFFCFSKEENAFLNEWSVTPAQLVAALPDVPIQVLWPGDAVLWEGWEDRNRTSLARWTEIMARPVPAKPHAAVEEADIVTAARALVREKVVRGLSRYGPRETHLGIRETGRAIAVDFRAGRVEILERADPQKLAITAPADELLFFFKSPHGETVLFGSCFRVADAERWRRLRDFRICRDAPAAIRCWITSLDRRFLGARLRGVYRGLTPSRVPLA